MILHIWFTDVKISVEVRLLCLQRNHVSSITLDEELFKEVEDFRFEHRYQTRNQATVELIRLGLAEIKKQQESS